MKIFNKKLFKACSARISFALLLTVLFMAFSPVTVKTYAMSDTEGTTETTETSEADKAAETKIRVIDALYLLTDEEVDKLDAYFAELSEELQFDIVLVTTSSLSGRDNIMEYADDYFDYKGYGYGDEYDGCILVRYKNGDEKELWISTCGLGQKCIYNNYIDYIFDEMTDDFLAGNYYESFRTYGRLVAESVREYKENGTPASSGGNSGKTYYYDEESENWFYYDDYEEDGFFDYLYGDLSDRDSFTVGDWALKFVRGMILPFIIGIVIALSQCKALKNQLKSVGAATEAGRYERDSSFVMVTQADNYLRTTTTKVRHVDTSSSGGGSYHSSSHHSSSGRSHGGGGRHM